MPVTCTGSVVGKIKAAMKTEISFLIFYILLIIILTLTVIKQGNTALVKCNKIISIYLKIIVYTINKSAFFIGRVKY